MNTNLEQAKQVVLHLPTEDLEKFDEWYKANRHIKPSGIENQKLKKYDIERFRKAQKWVSENREKYMNEWVCLEGDKLIAHGIDALHVHRKAKELGIEIPYLEHIVEESDWGGW